MWHVPPLAPCSPAGSGQEGHAPDPQVHEGGRPPPQGADRSAGSTGRSSTGATRWRTSSRRRGTSRRDRRPGTSSSPSANGSGLAAVEPTRGSDGMRAVVHDRYGPPEVLRLEEVERPVHRRTTRSSSAIHATTVTRTDCHMRAGEAVLLALHARPPATEAQDPGPRVRRRGRGGRRRRSPSSTSATASSVCGTARTRSTSACAKPACSRTCPTA